MLMKILSLNVRQWSRDLNSKAPTYWRKRAKAIKELIEREKPDIILFQELTVPMKWHVLPKGYKRATRFSISHHIYCTNSYLVKEREWHLHWCRALLYNKWSSGITAFNIFSVHSHWDRKIYTKVSEQILSNYKENRSSYIITIAGGDWNVDPEVMERRLRPLTLCRTHEETFQNWTKPESHGELDYFAYNHCKPLCRKLDDFVSDHKAVILEIQ